MNKMPNDMLEDMLSAIDPHEFIEREAIMEFEGNIPRKEANIFTAQQFFGSLNTYDDSVIERFINKHIEGVA